MNRVVFISCLVFLLSCQSNVICPAFQSTYILDDSVRDAHFSYVWQLDEVTRMDFLSGKTSSTIADTSYTSSYLADSITYFDEGEEEAVVQGESNDIDYYAYAEENSVVAWRPVKKTKFGIVKSSFYPIKNYQLKTAPMKNVLSPPDPVLETEGTSELETLDSLTVDSTMLATDSLLVATSLEVEQPENTTRFLFNFDPEDNFNLEQQYYIKYYGDLLVDHRKQNKTPLDTLGGNLSNQELAEDEKVPFFEKLKGFFSFGKKSNISDTTDFYSDSAVEESFENDTQVESDTL